MENKSQNNRNDNEVLAQLYQTGATDMPPASLDQEILQYAANAKESSHVGSHFAGGWKVPLSLAASLVLVFGILVQVDQSDQQLELPPIPELSTPGKTKDQKFNLPNATMDNIENEEDAFINHSLMDEETTATDSASGSQAVIIQSKEKAKLEQKRDRQQLKEQIIDPAPVEMRSSNEDTQFMELNRNSSSKPAEIERSDGIIDKTKSAKKPVQTEPALSGTMQNSDHDDLMLDKSTPARAAENEALSEQEYAPIPVGDWLLMIEKLIARKDYAEAARQLQKFKQAHPKVNVDDLDAKIP